MMEPRFDIESVNYMLRTRRSMFVAQFDPSYTIADDVIETILENANWAPTHKMTEPWRFTVFSGEGKAKFAQFQADLYKARAEKNDNFNEAVYQKMLENPLKASHIIAIGMKRSGAVPEMEEIAAVSMAVQNMYLTASAYGLAAYWGTGGVTFYEEAKPFFGLEPQDMLMGFFFIAKPLTDRWPNGKRNPIAEKVTWVK